MSSGVDATNCGAGHGSRRCHMELICETPGLVAHPNAHSPGNNARKKQFLRCSQNTWSSEGKRGEIEPQLANIHVAFADVGIALTHKTF